MEDNQSETTPLISRQTTNTRRSGNVERLSPLQKRKLACFCILVAEGLERLAFYSLFGNLLYFLTTGPLCWSTPLATAAQLMSNGLVYAVGFLAGWLSDTQFGRYFTIILGYSLYIIGYSVLPVLGHFVPLHSMNQSFNVHEGTSCTQSAKHFIPLCYETDRSYSCSTVLFASLSLISLGAGIVRTNLAPFGGDQVGFASTKRVLIYHNCLHSPLQGQIFPLILTACTNILMTLSL